MRCEWRERRFGDFRNWLAELGALLLIGAGLVWLHRSGAAVCLFHRLTGLPCLTCGTTRAAAALAAGQIGEALRLQPLAVLCGGAVAVFFAVHSYVLFVRRRVACVRLEPRERLLLAAFACALAALNWLYLAHCGV